jgi:hypothetical protein
MSWLKNDPTFDKNDPIHRKIDTELDKLAIGSTFTYMGITVKKIKTGSSKDCFLLSEASARFLGMLQ